MPVIHPTAQVDPGALIADDVEVGPYCVVGGGVAIAASCRLLPHVHVTGRTTIGPRCVIHPFASLGTPPQSVKYRGGPTRLVIGADCQIREGVTMNIGTEDGGGLTQVGERGFFMAQSHVGHDCRVGNDVVLANGAVLGGHCSLGDFVFMGGLSAAHQFTRLGASAMIAGITGVRSDVIPFGFAVGSLAYLDGLNVVGMKRRNFSRRELQAVRRAYRDLFLTPGIFAQRLDAVEAAYGCEAPVAAIITFIREGGKRSLCHPARGRQRAAVGGTDQQ
jgi:UDP-N-acetylglucosamine acyltransferase